MDITVQDCIRRIDESGLTNTPFLLRFVKQDGSIREMVAIKRNKQKKATGEAQEGSDFKYYLSHKHALLINEIILPKDKDKRLLHFINPSEHRQVPKTVKIYTIIGYNSNTVYA